MPHERYDQAIAQDLHMMRGMTRDGISESAGGGGMVVHYAAMSEGLGRHVLEEMTVKEFRTPCSWVRV
jgi:hypothetical protein